MLLFVENHNQRDIMTHNLAKKQAFKLKGRLYTLTVLQLLNANLTFLREQLTEVIAKAPRLFDKTPLVLDFSLIQEESVDFQGLIAELKRQGLIPIAQQGGNPLIEMIALSHGIPTLNASATQDKPLSEESVIDEPGQKFANQTKLWTLPVRSGQQIVSQDGDLIVTTSVGHGAELLAKGNIHVYGALRGRALAGINGDKHARIFCWSLEAELVSIAGIYRLSDAIESIPGPCQLFIQDDRIQIESIKLNALRSE